MALQVCILVLSSLFLSFTFAAAVADLQIILAADLEKRQAYTSVCGYHNYRGVRKWP